MKDLINEDLIKLTQESIAWASANGLLVNTIQQNDPPSIQYSHAPFTLIPTPVNRQKFYFAIDLSIPFNTLVDKIARNTQWVYEILKRVGEEDEFISKFIQICKLVEEEGSQQRCFLGIHRSDYMIDSNNNLLQVELNTMASSFGCLSTIVSKMHKFLFERFYDHKIIQNIVQGQTVSNSLIENSTMDNIIEAIAATINHYRQLTFEKKITVLFIVQNNEKNSLDQRWLEYGLWNQHKIPVIRKTLLDVFDCARIEGDNQYLFLDNHHIGLTYFRAGYTPRDYPTFKEWEARTLIERSFSIKCPSIQYHLVGSKKIQQEIVRPGVLEQFVDQEISMLLRKSFAGIWSLDDQGQYMEDIEAMKDALIHPEKYVMKPQREGGGNNFYGKDIQEQLSKMSSEELAAHILMQRIFPKKLDAILVHHCSPNKTSVVQELGIFGAFLGDDSRVIFNKPSGFLLRTKGSEKNEGGVASGHSCIDSPFLVD